MVQWLIAAAKDHSLIQGAWLLLLESDYVWHKPLMVRVWWGRVWVVAEPGDDRGLVWGDGRGMGCGGAHFQRILHHHNTTGAHTHHAMQKE